MEEKYQKLKAIVESELGIVSPAHDMEHVMRVYELCLSLAGSDPTIDLDVLKSAALLHDIARMKETREVDHAILGAKIAQRVLKGQGYSEEKIERIKHCIIAHRFRGKNEPKTREAQVLSDADKLDALGAVGIARSFVLAGELHEQIYSDVKMPLYVKQNLASNGRIKDLSRHAPNIEFEMKLKRIPDRLHTPKAKEIARERLAFMEQFFHILKKEMNGR